MHGRPVGSRSQQAHPSRSPEASHMDLCLLYEMFKEDKVGVCAGTVQLKLERLLWGCVWTAEGETWLESKLKKKMSLLSMKVVMHFAKADHMLTGGQHDTPCSSGLEKTLITTELNNPWGGVVPSLLPSHARGLFPNPSDCVQHRMCTRRCGIHCMM
eukprot:1715284-Amphidinium_carterae.1